VRCLLALSDVGNEAPDPVCVAALGSIRVVPGADAQPELLEGRQGAGPTLFIDDGGLRASVPVGSLEEVDEIDPERVLRLLYLPVLIRAGPFELLTEPSHPVGERFVRGRSGEEAADPTHAARRCLLHQLRLEQEVTELLQ